MAYVSFYIKMGGLLAIISLNPQLPSSLLGSTLIND